MIQGSRAGKYSIFVVKEAIKEDNPVFIQECCRGREEKDGQKIGKERKWPMELPNCFVQNLTQSDNAIVHSCLRGGRILTLSQKEQHEI